MAFSLRQVAFAHPGRTVFDGLDLTLPAGRFIGIVGPNGCGKTTLLDLLCRHRLPDHGEIRYAGRPLAGFGKRALAREIAWCPRTTGSISRFVWKRWCSWAATRTRRVSAPPRPTISIGWPG
ncbi:ATP-binding cassette domain-containing protein [Desulfosarcina cetonica]|uniref:ATP-binding cassette domain-containing protein n=1 Tax=Desulfosarcina cetonica TaxID=90730 RepID=UPI000ACF53B2|nr:ATP-binding cassette domain-containing protein [Desulfosarcina cetonica]